MSSAIYRFSSDPSSCSPNTYLKANSQPIMSGRQQRTMVSPINVIL
jgi:hypothetical protein